MAWLKTHYEKVVLALVLVLLIVSAAALSLKVGQLNQETRDLPRAPKPKLKPTQPANLGTYTAVIQMLQDPPLWTNVDRGLTSPNVVSGPGGVDGTSVIPTNDQPVLVSVSYTPFYLLFKEYSSSSGQGRNFQLNFRTWSKSFIVREVGDEVADRFVQTGYFIKKFEQKKTTTTGGVSGDQDLSELTLQHEGEDPIVLVYNKEASSKEPIAHLGCKGSTQLQDVRRTQTFHCGDFTYNVVDINPRQMVIKETKSGVQTTIPLSAPKK
jgi:hypothetical protein